MAEMAASAQRLELIDCYTHALGLTEQMLDAAQKGDWDRLVKVEIERGRLMDHLRDTDCDPPAANAALIQQREIIESILAQDQQIKMLTQDWMHELRDILGSSTAQRLLNRTYDVT